MRPEQIDTIIGAEEILQQSYQRLDRNLMEYGFNVQRIQEEIEAGRTDGQVQPISEGTEEYVQQILNSINYDLRMIESVLYSSDELLSRRSPDLDEEFDPQEANNFDAIRGSLNNHARARMRDLLDKCWRDYDQLQNLPIGSRVHNTRQQVLELLPEISTFRIDFQNLLADVLSIFNHNRVQIQQAIRAGGNNQDQLDDLQRLAVSAHAIRAERASAQQQRQRQQQEQQQQQAQNTPPPPPPAPPPPPQPPQNWWQRLRNRGSRAVQNGVQHARNGVQSVRDSNLFGEAIASKVKAKVEELQRTDPNALRIQMGDLAIVLGDERFHAELSRALPGVEGEEAIRVEVNRGIPVGKNGGIIKALFDMCNNWRLVDKMKPVEEMVEEILEAAVSLRQSKMDIATPEGERDRNNTLARLISQRVDTTITPKAAPLQGQPSATKTEREPWYIQSAQWFDRNVLRFVGVDQFMLPVVERLSGKKAPTNQAVKTNRQPRERKSATDIRYGPHRK